MLGWFGYVAENVAGTLVEQTQSAVAKQGNPRDVHDHSLTWLYLLHYSLFYRLRGDDRGRELQEKSRSR